MCLIHLNSFCIVFMIVRDLLSLIVQLTAVLSFGFGFGFAFVSVLHFFLSQYFCISDYYLTSFVYACIAYKMLD